MKSYYSTAAVAAGLLAATYVSKRLLFPQRSELRGKVVLITGGSRGLGLSLAQEFGKQGAILALCARDEAELQQACQMLREQNMSATPFVVDLGDRNDDQSSFIQSVIQRMGAIDVLINNAGLIRVGPLSSTTSADYEAAMDLMFWAPLHLSLAVKPHMEARGSGKIINIASVGGRVSIPHLLPYSCAKFALVALSTGLSAELKGSGIHVLTVMPGLMRTGSYLNASFAGKSKHEFAWFGILGNLPGFTVAASYAASQIRKALDKNQYECTISLPAKLLIGAETLLPELTREIMAGISQLLPGGTNKTVETGHQLNPSLGSTFQAVTTLGHQAAAQYNE